MSPDAKAAMNAWLETVGPAKQPDGFTSAELSTAWGTAKCTTLARMRTLIDAGRMKFAGRRNITRIDGRPDTSPVYKLVKK